jgi:hypothetical protein
MARPTVPSPNRHDGSLQTRGATRPRQRRPRSIRVRYWHPGTACRPPCCGPLANAPYRGARPADRRPHRSAINAPDSIASKVYVVRARLLEQLRRDFVVAHPQAPHISTGRYPCHSCLTKHRYSQVSSRSHRVVHSREAFMHVAIHKIPRVVCRWPRQPAFAFYIGFAKSRNSTA